MIETSPFTDTIGRALLESETDAILAVDRTGQIRFWNPGAARIFGISSVDAVGQPLDIIIPQNLRARHIAGFAEAMRTGQTSYEKGSLMAVPAITRDGRRLSIEFSIMFLRETSGDVIGMAAIIRDRTPDFEEIQTLRRKAKELEGDKRS